MEAIFKLIGDYYAFAIIVAAFMAILSRVGNIIIRAFSGKEDFF